MATKKVTKTRSPLAVGNKVHLRTVTHYYLGKIIEIYSDHLVLDDASWVAWPQEYFSEILATGKVTDVEPYCDPVAIMTGAIVDITTWNHTLPRKQQ